MAFMAVAGAASFKALYLLSADIAYKAFFWILNIVARAGRKHLSCHDMAFLQRSVLGKWRTMNDTHMDSDNHLYDDLKCSQL